MQSQLPSYPAAKAFGRLAGWSYLLLAVCGVFGGFVAIASQVVPGDATATAENIQDAGLHYRLGIIAWSATIILDVVVAWAIYQVTLAAGPALAMVTGWFRLAYVAVHGAAISHLALAQKYAAGEGFLAVMPREQLAALASASLVAHKTGFEIALAFFGVHLLLLGAIFLRAKYLPGWIGVLIGISGAVYICNAVVFLALADYDVVAQIMVAIVSVTAVIAELSLALYLIVRGVGRNYAASATKGC